MTLRCGRSEGRDWYSVGICTCDRQRLREVCLLPSSGSNLLVANLCSKQSVVAKQGVVQRWSIDSCLRCGSGSYPPKFRKLRKDCYSVGVSASDWRLRSVDKLSWKVFVGDKDSDSWYTAKTQSNLVANTKRASVRKVDGHFDVVDCFASECRRSGWNSAEDRACFVADAFLHAGHTVIS